MWYRIAINLKDLNEEFSDEKKATEIESALESGNEYSSDSLSVRNVQPSDPESVSGMHVNFDLMFDDTDPHSFLMSTTTLLDHVIDNYEGGKFVKRNRQGAINHFISLSDTLGTYIDSGVNKSFREKLKSFELVLEDLILKAKDYTSDTDKINSRFKRIREIALSDFDSMSEEERNKLLAEKEELYRQHENEEYRAMSDEDLSSARFIFEQISKLIGEMYSRINLYEGRLQWMNDMIQYTIPLNYLPEYDNYNDMGNNVSFNPKQLYVERFNRR